MTSAGQQVARELDALVGQAEGAGERMRERGLADARDVLDEQVTARQQARKAQAQLALLAEDDAAERRDGGFHALDAGRVERGRGTVRGRAHAPAPAALTASRRRICSASCASCRSNSAIRSRSLVTTSGGALATKFSLRELRHALVAVLRCARVPLLEARDLRGHVVDQPRERREDRAAVDDGDGARRQFGLRGDDGHRLQVADARDGGAERRDRSGVSWPVRPDVDGRRARVRHVEFAADLADPEHHGLQQLHLPRGLRVLGEVGGGG